MKISPVDPEMVATVGADETMRFWRIFDKKSGKKQNNEEQGYNVLDGKNRVNQWR